MIFFWSDIEKVKDVSLSTSVSGDTGRTRYHLLKYKKKPLIFQFPIISIISVSRNWIKFELCRNEKRIDKFVNGLTDLNDKIYKKIQSRYNKPIHWDDILNKGKERLQLDAFVSKCCLIFNDAGVQSQLKLIDLKNSAVEFIVQVSRVQIISPFDDDTTLYGKLLLDVLQIRHNSCNVAKLDTYSFQNHVNYRQGSNQDKRNILCAHDDYRKYFDMLKMGVPRKAVEQRIISEGLDIGILDGKICNESSKKPSQLSISDLKNCKLKKTEVVKEKKVYKMGFGFGISFDEIQKSLRSLRKTHLIAVK